MFSPHFRRWLCQTATLGIPCVHTGSQSQSQMLSSTLNSPMLRQAAFKVSFFGDSSSPWESTSGKALLSVGRMGHAPILDAMQQHKGHILALYCGLSGTSEYHLTSDHVTGVADRTASNADHLTEQWHSPDCYGDQHVEHSSGGG